MKKLREVRGVMREEGIQTTTQRADVEARSTENRRAEVIQMKMFQNGGGDGHSVCIFHKSYKMRFSSRISHVTIAFCFKTHTRTSIVTWGGFHVTMVFLLKPTPKRQS